LEYTNISIPEILRQTNILERGSCPLTFPEPEPEPDPQLIPVGTIFSFKGGNMSRFIHCAVIMDANMARLTFQSFLSDRRLCSSYTDDVLLNNSETIPITDTVGPGCDGGSSQATFQITLNIAESNGATVLNLTSTNSLNMISRFVLTEAESCQTLDSPNSPTVPAPEPGVEFPIGSAITNRQGSISMVSDGQNHWNSGDYMEQTITNTGICSLTSLRLIFIMTDSVNSEEGQGTRSFQVDIVAADTTTLQKIGTYSFERRLGDNNNITVNRFYDDFGSISGTGEDGDSYTIRITATASAGDDDSSWQWEAGGIAILAGTPCSEA